MAAAAVELAQSYQKHGSRERWMYWLYAVGGVSSIIALILSAAASDLIHAVIFASLTLISIVQLTLNPALRPKSVALSLEASRHVVAQGG